MNNNIINNTDNLIISIIKNSCKSNEIYYSITTDLELAKYHYYKLKFLLRNIDFNIGTNAIDDFVAYTDQYNVPCSLISEIVNRNIINKIKVFLDISYAFNKIKKYNMIIPFLEQIEKFSISKESICYIYSYFLYAMNEPELALKMMSEYNVSSDTLLEMEKLIKNKGSLPDFQISYDEIKEKSIIGNSELTFAFIICVSNEQLFEECKLCIDSLYKPDKATIEIIPVRNAKSITSGYNIGMSLTNSHYKIYIHQDAFIINKNFIYDIVNLFNQDADIGLIGIAGTNKIPDSGVWWETNQNISLSLYSDTVASCNRYQKYNSANYYYDDVSAIDGVLMATSKDIRWREDLFTGWDFYDISESMEFKKNKYKVIVPKQDDCWCLHEGNINNPTEAYEYYRKIFLDEYKWMI